MWIDKKCLICHMNIASDHTLLASVVIIIINSNSKLSVGNRASAALRVCHWGAGCRDQTDRLCMWQRVQEGHQHCGCDGGCSGMYVFRMCMCVYDVYMYVCMYVFYSVHIHVAWMAQSFMSLICSGRLLCIVNSALPSPAALYQSSQSILGQQISM